MANKITKREVIGMMMNNEVIKANDLFMGYLENELALLDKKASTKRKKSDSDENIRLRDFALEVLENIGSGTISEIQSGNPELKCLSNQKVTALMRPLIESGEVVKVIDKKKSIYRIANGES